MYKSMAFTAKIFYNTIEYIANSFLGSIVTKMLSKRSFQAIYRFLDNFSPVDCDCGELCGAICCLCDSGPDGSTPSSESDENADFSMGLYLLPGEEQLFDGNEDWIDWGSISAEEYDFPDSWTGRVPFFQCRTAPLCPREQRPIQCRTFPLAPHIDEDGFLYVIYHRDPLPYYCPLISEQDKYPLNMDFIKATWRVWSHLVRDPAIMDLVEMESKDRIHENWPVDILWPA